MPQASRRSSASSAPMAGRGNSASSSVLGCRSTAARTVLAIGASWGAPGSGAEGEGAADRADHEPVAELSVQRDHRLEAGAVLWHQVVEPERAEGVGHAGDALLAEPAQVKA